MELEVQLIEFAGGCPGGPVVKPTPSSIGGCRLDPWMES